MVDIIGYLHCYDNLSKKWPKMTTAVHFFTNNSQTKVVSSLKDYSSEGLSTVNVAGKAEFLLNVTKVQEAKVLALFTACSLT
jgi:UDP-2,3-diacylglucosamine pyrophosphatase LpxH